MPILSNDLRSPDQRRTDQLTILKRRAPPPRSAGRFFKIVTDTAAHAIGKFDPSFDSDADTDGPTSGSSLWRRELSRVRSTSSATTNASVNPEVSTPTMTRHSSLVAVRGPASAEETGAAEEMEEKKEIQEESMAIVPSTNVKSSSLPRALQCTSGCASVCAGGGPWREKEGERETEEREENERDGDGNTSGHCVPWGKGMTTAGVFERDRARSFYGARGGREAGEEEEEIEMEVEESVTSSDFIGTLSSRQLRKVLDEDYELFYRRATADEEMQMLDDELTRLTSGEIGHSRVSSSGVPLFVEEIGRIPRVAIVDGKLQRVKVRKEPSASFRVAGSKHVRNLAVRTVSKCLPGRCDRDNDTDAPRVKKRRRRRRGIFKRKAAIFTSFLPV